MPLYEYECDACGHRVEIIQKFSDPPLDRCPRCGGAVHKLQSAPAFQFKGSGWYITDYARKGQPEKAEGGGAAAAAGDEKADKSGKTDKPAGSGGSGAAAAPPAAASASKDTKD
jgi:putative FmdB family regulatory protein